MGKQLFSCKSFMISYFSFYGKHLFYYIPQSILLLHVNQAFNSVLIRSFPYIDLVLFGKLCGLNQIPGSCSSRFDVVLPPVCIQLIKRIDQQSRRAQHCKVNICVHQSSHSNSNDDEKFSYSVLIHINIRGEKYAPCLCHLNRECE